MPASDRFTSHIMLDVIAIAVSVLLLASCTGTAKPGREAWQRARTLAETHLRQLHGEPPAWRIVEVHEGTPFLFTVRSPKTSAVLVHENDVFTQRGLGGLDRYLRESRCVELRTADIGNMMVLLQLFDTFPPYEYARDYVRRRSPMKALRPSLAFHDGGRSTLHLFYWSRSTKEEHSEDDEEEVTLIEWTLTMNPGQAPFWTRANRHWDTQRNVFTDADHKN